MLERICWLSLALFVHLPPFATLFAPSLITKLYDVAPNAVSFPLPHHRAALFEILMIACLWAGFDPDVRKSAFEVTSLSMVSFLAIYFGNGQPPSLKTIALVDGAGLPFLAFVGWKAFVN